MEPFPVELRNTPATPVFTRVVSDPDRARQQ